MYAVEFEANIRNGVVEIPQDVKDLGDIRKAKFIMMFDKETKKRAVRKEEKKEKMSAISIDTIGFKFNREEAHER
jgi:hypothetical protein